MSFKGKKNIYTCSTCGAKIITVDLDEGTTPMFLSCRATPNCAGRMSSAMYQVDQTQQPTHEWYKPTGKVRGAFREHVERGGLLIRVVKQ